LHSARANLTINCNLLLLRTGGTRDASNLLTGGCGVVEGAFACSRAMTLTVEVLPDDGWIPFAAWDGTISVTAAMYNQGFGSLGGANFATPCGLFDAYPGDDVEGKLTVRMRMGVYVDYLKPAGTGAFAQTLCTMLSTPGTWFRHSTVGEFGPWRNRNGIHDALLGGWLYTDEQPADAGDDRTWGNFWGTKLYFEETGLCCHAAKGDMIGFTRSLRVDLKVTV
jgi:hypothetical protein